VLLFIHATPLRHRQTLQVLAHNEPFVSASVSTYNVAICFISITMLYHASGEHPSPCGLYDSLCTLRVGRSTIRLSFPVTQHSVRVVGYSFPDRDSHPARNTRLCLAHTLALCHLIPNGSITLPPLSRLFLSPFCSIEILACS